MHLSTSDQNLTTFLNKRLGPKPETKNALLCKDHVARKKKGFLLALWGIGGKNQAPNADLWNFYQNHTAIWFTGTWCTGTSCLNFIKIGFGRCIQCPFEGVHFISSIPSSVMIIWFLGPGGNIFYSSGLNEVNPLVRVSISIAKVLHRGS